MMKRSKKFAVPALVIGLAVIGGGTAFAAGNGFDTSALTGFTDAQKTAIEQAFEIRKDADEKAKQILTDAGVDQKKLGEQMRSQHEAKRKAMDAALDANDYAAFQTAVAGSPMADKLTTDVFAKLVEIRTLEKSGDKEGAMKLRKELGTEVGFGGMGMGGHRGGPDGEKPADASQN